MDSLRQPSQTSVNTEAQSSPQMQGNSKKSILLPVGLGILVVLIAIGAYLLGTNQSKPVVENTIQTTPIPSPTPDPTANWKTYTNTPEGFSLKYPDDWALVDITSSNYAEVLKYLRTDLVINSSDVIYSQASMIKGSKIRINVNMLDEDRKKFYSIGQFPTSHPESRNESTMILEDEIVINGNKAIKREFANILGFGKNYTHTSIYLIKNNKVYGLTCHAPKSDKEKCDQILSTFKFTN